MAPHGAVATEEVAVKAEENSAGEAGLSSTARFYLTRRTGERLSAHRHLKLNSSLTTALRNLWS